jgi:hypothetical protein
VCFVRAFLQVPSYTERGHLVIHFYRKSTVFFFFFFFCASSTEPTRAQTDIESCGVFNQGGQVSENRRLFSGDFILFCHRQKSGNRGRRLSSSSNCFSYCFARSSVSLSTRHTYSMSACVVTGSIVLQTLSALPALKQCDGMVRETT